MAVLFAMSQSCVRAGGAAALLRGLGRKERKNKFVGSESAPYIN